MIRLSEFMPSCEELKLHMAKGRLYVKRITNMKKVAVIYLKAYQQLKKENSQTEGISLPRTS